MYQVLEGYRNEKDSVVILVVVTELEKFSSLGE